MCEDIYDSNPLIPTSCVVSQSVQISEETKKEVISHRTTPLVERGENIVVVQNQFVAPINMKHEDEGGTLLSNHDKTSAANLIDLTQSFHVDSTHLKVNSCAEILQVAKVCSSLHNSYSILKPCNNLNANKLHYVQFITHAESFAKYLLLII
jgi:hypothetical protein